MSKTTPTHPSGIVQVEDGIVYYEWPIGRHGRSNSIGIPLVDVKVIGEYTNQNGPFADDYFICFVTDAPGWTEVSFYAEGRDALLSELEAYFGADILLGLCWSTDFNSRILWPLRLTGREFIEFKPIKPESRWVQFVRSIFPGVSLHLSHEVQSYLRLRKSDEIRTIRSDPALIGIFRSDNDLWRPTS